MLRVFAYGLAIASGRRRVVSAALLTVYLLTAAGVPLPSGVRPHHTGELYPCANCACGCTSAEHCWQSCCCHTLAERFAWAREHHVRPPEFAIAAAQRAGLNLAWLEKSGHQPACCQSHSQCCKNTERSCCPVAHAETKKTSNADHIVAWRALSCRGQSLNWLAAVPTRIVARPTILHDTSLTAWLGPAVSDTAERVALQPTVPPPEWT